MGLFRVFISTGHWYYVWAGSDGEAIGVMDSWGTDGDVVGVVEVDHPKPIIMGPL